MRDTEAVAQALEDAYQWATHQRARVKVLESGTSEPLKPPEQVPEAGGIRLWKSLEELDWSLQQSDFLNHRYPDWPGWLRRLTKPQVKINRLLIRSLLLLSAAKSLLSKRGVQLQGLVTSTQSIEEKTRSHSAFWPMRKQARFNRLLLEAIRSEVREVRRQTAGKDLLNEFHELAGAKQGQKAGAFSLLGWKALGQHRVNRALLRMLAEG